MKANPPYDLYGDDMKIEDLAQNRYVDAEFIICEGPIVEVSWENEYAYLCKMIADSFGQKTEDVEKNVLRYAFEPYDHKTSKMKGICLIFIAGFGGVISLILFLIKIESRKEEVENEQS